MCMPCLRVVYAHVWVGNHLDILLYHSLPYFFVIESPLTLELG